eukprot:10630415-Alexandrium_andersonii.AAC.1
MHAFETCIPALSALSNVIVLPNSDRKLPEAAPLMANGVLVGCVSWLDAARKAGGIQRSTVT